MQIDLISHVPGVGPTAQFNPGPNTPPQYLGPHTGAFDGTTKFNSTKNMAEIYNRMLLANAAVIVESGLTIDNDNWTQLATAVRTIANSSAAAAANNMQPRIRDCSGNPVGVDTRMASCVDLAAAATSTSSAVRIGGYGRYWTNMAMNITDTYGSATFDVAFHKQKPILVEVTWKVKPRYDYVPSHSIPPGSQFLTNISYNGAPFAVVQNPMLSALYGDGGADELYQTYRFIRQSSGSINIGVSSTINAGFGSGDWTMDDFVISATTII